MTTARTRGSVGGRDDAKALANARPGAADVEQLEALVEPLWKALARVRRQSARATSRAEIRDLTAQRRALRARIRALDARIEQQLVQAPRLGRLATELRAIASELRAQAGRIRGVQSALERSAEILQLVDRALDLLA